MIGYLSRSVPPLIRLMARAQIDHITGCWLWTGSKNGRGYGSIYLDGKRVGAHVASWILFKGPIPDGMNVCHHCDNPPCINPHHEFLGSQSDNLKDAVKKGRVIPPNVWTK